MNDVAMYLFPFTRLGGQLPSNGNPEDNSDLTLVRLTRSRSDSQECNGDISSDILSSSPASPSASPVKSHADNRRKAKKGEVKVEIKQELEEENEEEAEERRRATRALRMVRKEETFFARRSDKLPSIPFDGKLMQNQVNQIKMYQNQVNALATNYASSSSGDAYSDRQLTTNFEL